MAAGGEKVTLLALLVAPPFDSVLRFFAGMLGEPTLDGILGQASKRRNEWAPNDPRMSVPPQRSERVDLVFRRRCATEQKLKHGKLILTPEGDIKRISGNTYRSRSRDHRITAVSRLTSNLISRSIFLICFIVERCCGRAFAVAIGRAAL